MFDIIWFQISKIGVFMVLGINVETG
jgi:hypothetical protein